MNLNKILTFFSFFGISKGHPINARIKAKPMNRFFGLTGGVNSGMGVGMGLVSPANVPLPVPVILAPGAPLPVAVAPVPTNAVPLAAAAAAPSAAISSSAAAAVSAAAAASTPMKNGYSVTGAGTPPPLEASNQVVGSGNSAGPSQQAPHAQTHPQQPRFLYAAPTPGAPYGAQPQLQLYAFHPPASFYTPTLLQVNLTLNFIFYYYFITFFILFNFFSLFLTFFFIRFHYF